MGISSIRATEPMPIRQPQATDSQPVDSVSKNIQNEISDAQRQKQGLSSKEDISVEEKMKKSRELQQEISSLNVKLRQRELVVSREEKRAALSEETRRENISPANEDRDSAPKVSDRADSGAKQDETKKAGSKDSESKTSEVKDSKSKESETKSVKAEDSKTSDTELSSIVKAESDIKQAKARNAVITKMQDGIVTLKSEIRQDENRGEDVEKKKAELAKQEAKLQRATSEQFSDPNKANKTANTAAKLKIDETPEQSGAILRANQNSQPKIIIDGTNIPIN